jgi:GTP-binding protein
VTRDRIEFVGAQRRPGDPLPTRLPQVALVGRSNVGKSSLINALLGRKRLARVSKTPGRTREIHFYEVDERLCLVDLPGYGFASVPPEVRQRWTPLIESYLSTSPGLVGVVLLLDARRGLSQDDRGMIDQLARLGTPTLFALTKVDKLSRSERHRAARALQETLELPGDQVVATSAVSGEGTETLWKSVVSALEEAAN